MIEEEGGTALERSEEFERSPDDTDAYKRARHEIGLVLQEHCVGPVDVNNVRSRLEAALLACAEYGQKDAAHVEESFGVGLKAFLDYTSIGKSSRRTRPGGAV